MIFATHLAGTSHERTEFIRKHAAERPILGVNAAYTHSQVAKVRNRLPPEVIVRPCMGNAVSPLDGGAVQVLRNTRLHETIAHGQNYPGSFSRPS